MVITNPDYNVGTVSITENTKVLTGVGTMWLSADLEKGDQFGFDGYAPARIDTITADGTITLLDTWRGPTLTGSPYFIRYQADGSGLTGQSVSLRRMLSQPLITAFTGLAAAADKLMYFTGANTMALVDFKGWARSLLGLTPAANKGVYFTDANTAALFDLAANPRAALGDNANFTAAMVALLKLAGSPAADKLPYLTGASAAALADLTPYARTLLDDANAGAAQTTLGISNFIKALLDDTDGGAALATLGVTKSLAGSGYYRFPSGIIIQWVNVSNPLSDYAQLHPLTYPTACVAISIINVFGVGSTSFIGVSSSNVSASSFDVRCRSISAGAVAAATNVPVLAITLGF